MPTKKAEMASLLESAVSGEAFLAQADSSVITLGGSTSTARAESPNEGGVRRETTREQEKNKLQERFFVIAPFEDDGFTASSE